MALADWGVTLFIIGFVVALIVVLAYAFSGKNRRRGREAMVSNFFAPSPAAGSRTMWGARSHSDDLDRAVTYPMKLKVGALKGTYVDRYGAGPPAWWRPELILPSDEKTYGKVTPRAGDELAPKYAWNNSGDCDCVGTSYSAVPRCVAVNSSRSCQNENCVAGINCGPLGQPQVDSFGKGPPTLDGLPENWDIPSAPMIDSRVSCDVEGKKRVTHDYYDSARAGAVAACGGDGRPGCKILAEPAHIPLIGSNSF